MSKIIGILLVLAVVMGVLVAIDPESRARAINAWEHTRVAWGEFSRDFSVSMTNLMAQFRQGFDKTGSTPGDEKQAGASEEEQSGTPDNLDAAAFLQNLWRNISSDLTATG